MNIETVRNQLKSLKLYTASSELEQILSQQKKSVSLSWLSELLEHEIDSRKEKAQRARIKRANFPEITSLESFDWSFNPEINEAKIRELAGLNFIANNQIALFLGQTGTGKSHLALAIGVLAANKGYKVYCTSFKGLARISFRPGLKITLIVYLKRFFQLSFGYLMTGALRV